MEAEDRYLSQRSMKDADKYLSRINMETVNKYLPQLDLKFCESVNVLSVTALKSYIGDLEAKIRGQSDSFGDCIISSCVEDCPDSDTHIDLSQEIARINFDINRIRLSLLRIGKGLSFVHQYKSEFIHLEEHKCTY